MTDHGNEDNAHTVLHPRGGVLKHIVPSGPRRSKLDPPTDYPVRKGLRYALDMLTLGKLETLAKARFQIRQLTSEDQEMWVEDAEFQDALAQSVNASSKIEGEGIAVDELALAFAAVTEPTNEKTVTGELEMRRNAIRSIYNAAVWALTRDWTQFITYDFVMELHKRMLFSTKPNVAGKIKEKPVVIKGGGYYIETLPPKKAQAFLRSLCNRTNELLLKAREEASCSMFLSIAEFVSDFLAIHPFADGNGRSARLLSTYLLERCGYHFARFYPVDSIILESRKRYYEALFLAQRRWYLGDEDMTAWIDYYTSTVFIQWTRAFQRVRDEANRSARE